MRKLIFVIMLVASGLRAQELYIRTFGKADAKPLIFLHGGPGYNCANFEGTTAKRLAENGYFVIVYDRRGEGRSKDSNAAYTFQQTFDDLNAIYKRYGIQKANLIGHSFGGVVAPLFAKKYPEKVNSIILVGAPVSLQETFRTIISSCREIYKAKKDTQGLKKLDKIEKMDKTSAEYFSSCFMQAGNNRFYNTKNPSEEMKTIYKSFWKDTLIKWTFVMEVEGPSGFLKNENYTSIDLTNDLKELVAKKMPIFALYGKEDGLFSPKQVQDAALIIGEKNLKYLDNCSHNVFSDQQTIFVQSLNEWIK